MLPSKDNGSLMIGSLEAFHHALLQKWRLRFLKNEGALWTWMIKMLHDIDGGIHVCESHSRGVGGGWGLWLSLEKYMQKVLSYFSILEKRLEMGLILKFRVMLRLVVCLS